MAVPLALEQLLRSVLELELEDLLQLRIAGSDLAAMVARALFLWDHPIPIVFHWVLAAFVITVGISHRRRLRR